MPSVEERVQGYVDSGYFEQYGHIFHQMLVAHLMLLRLHRQIFMELEHLQQLNLSMLRLHRQIFMKLEHLQQLHLSMLHLHHTLAAVALDPLLRRRWHHCMDQDLIFLLQER